MALNNWIDTLAARFEMSDFKGGTLKSYRIFERSEFPEGNIQIPCAITYPTTILPHLAKDGSYMIVRGITEFHLTSSLDSANMGYLLRFPLPIMQAVAGKIKLGGLVSEFSIDPDQGLRGPVSFTKSDDSKRFGFMLHWIVRENIATEITVSA